MWVDMIAEDLFAAEERYNEDIMSNTQPTEENIKTETCQACLNKGLQ